MSFYAAHRQLQIIGEPLRVDDAIGAAIKLSGIGVFEKMKPPIHVASGNREAPPE